MVRSSGAAIGLVVLVVITAAVGSACSTEANRSPVEQSGQTTDDSSITATDNTTSAWVAEANRICTEADREIDTLPAPRSRGEVSSFIASVIAMNHRWNDELTALGAPPGEERRFRRLVDLLAEDERLLDRVLAATSAGDRKAFDARMADYRAVGERQNALWRTLGANRCAENAYTPS